MEFQESYLPSESIPESLRLGIGMWSGEAYENYQVCKKRIQ